MHWTTVLARELRLQLHDDNQPLTIALLCCGSDCVDRLRFSSCHLESSHEILEDLLSTAHSKLSSSAIGSITFSWRRLYTDSSLLRVLADINAVSSVDEAVALQSIACLDRAIVVAGPAGEGRLELILDMIDRLQARWPPTISVMNDADAVALPTPLTDSPLLVAASGHVVCLETAPSLSSFLSAFCQRPFVVRGYATDWPALHQRPWSSFQYLRTVGGQGRVVPVEVGSDYRTDDWSQTFLPWDDFLAYLERSNKSTPDQVLYLAQHSLLTQFPTLRRDIAVPDYVYACPSPTSDFPDYQPPGNEEQLVTNIWFGPKGTISPAHTDPYFNVYVQVVGRKTIWLAPPHLSSSLYPYPPSVSGKAHNPAANTTIPSMSNTSRVDVFEEHWSSDDYPKFQEEVVPHAVCTVLGPGDLLFFPPGWWHAMRSEEVSLSLSMWF